jgi:uncharacterized alpha-E superfamily protein
MLSRTADALFWMGRYAERAGNLARGMQAALRMSVLHQPPTRRRTGATCWSRQARSPASPPAMPSRRGRR